MTRRTPVHVRRAELIGTQSKMLVRALFEHEVQQLDLASAVGREADKVQRVCDANRRETLSIVDARMAREAGGDLELVALEVAAWVLGREYVVSRVPACANVED